MERAHSLVKEIATSVLVVLAALDNLATDVAHSDARVVLKLRPLLLGALVLAIAATSEGIKLGKDTTTTVKERLKSVGLLEVSDARGDGADERHRFGIDGEVVVKSVVEERVEVGDLRVDLQQGPERELGLANSLGSVLMTMYRDMKYSPCSCCWRRSWSYAHSACSAWSPHERAWWGGTRPRPAPPLPLQTCIRLRWPNRIRLVRHRDQHRRRCGEERQCGEKPGQDRQRGCGA